MKTKTTILEEIVYILMCICSLGAIYWARVTISMAIRKALEDKPIQKVVVGKLQ